MKTVARFAAALLAVTWCFALADPAPSVTAAGGDGQSARVNSAFSTQLQVKVRDSDGGAARGVTVTFTAPSTGPSGTFDGTGTRTATSVTNAGGVANAPVFRANAVAGGPYNVMASVAGAAAATFVLTNTAGPAANVTATAGTPQSTAVNTPFTTRLQATVKDASNNPVSGVTVTFTAPASGPSGTFPGGSATATAVTNSSGTATAPVFAANGNAGGPYNVVASVSGAASANFALTNAATTASLSISKTHTGTFTQGQQNAPYTVIVSNAANAAPTSAAVTVTDTIPAGLTLVSMSGNGWNCTANTCTRNDALPAGLSYPEITVLVNVAANAPGSVTNHVAVSGGRSFDASSDDVTTITAKPPVLNITKTHVASFFQSQQNATYTVTVSNAATAGPANGTVTVTDTLPAGLTLVSMAGQGWVCSAATCTRTDALQAGSSYPAITVTVSVDANAPASVTNQAVVSGGGAASASASDPTTVTINPPILSISKTHAGNFTQGQQNATYTVVVSNAANAGPTSGAVTVAETLPPGLSLVSMSGAGWTCTANTCTRNNALSGGASYPAITVTVNVAANASSPQVNSVTVSGGGSADANATNSTVIASNPAVLTVTKTHSGAFAQGQQGAAYSVVVSNAAAAGATSGTVAVTDTLPSGLSLVSMSGTGWACTSATCSRNDVLNGGSSYPPITVAVNVAGNAASPQINSVTVSGGGSADASAVDSTAINANSPVLSIAKTHQGNFEQGQQNTYSVVVSNAAGAGPTSGTVAVTDTVPPGLRLVSIAGAGWTCTASTCSRSDVLPGGQSYPAITVAVNVSATASSPQVNAVSVSGGGAADASATDSTIIVPFTISTASLPDGQVGSTYSQTVQISGGTGPFAWSISSGTLPNGLALNTSTGVISGSPTAAGPANFTVKVIDSVAAAVTQAYSFNVSNAALKITTASLPDGQAGVAYSETVQAVGGTGSYTFSIGAGVLPNGLSLNASTGLISGTPTSAGAASFTVKVTDTASATATQAYTFNIANPALKILTTSLNDGQAGSSYSQTLQASGGSGSYTWSVSTGALPNALTLSATTGAISGTPSASGTSNFTVKVTDTASASTAQALSINVVPAPLKIMTASLPDGQVGTNYAQTLQGSGGTGGYTWSIASGTLPGGLNWNSNGQISGIPLAAGTASITVKLADSASASTTQQLSINIAASPLRLTVSSLPDGQVGVAYEQTLQADSGTPPYTWAVASGTLPPGLQLTAGTGQISGTPSTSGTFAFSVSVTDKYAAMTQAVSVRIAPAALVTLTSSLPNGSVGAPFSQTLQASGGTPPYKWAITSGALPTGLSLGDNGQMTGSPSSANTFSFTAQVTDTASVTASANLSITIVAGVAVSACPSSTAAVSQPYTAALQAAGGTSPYSWSISAGQLPQGLTLDSQRAQVTGTPSAAGAFNYTIKVNDNGGGSNTLNCALTVNPALSISTGLLPDGTVGVSYSQTLTASGGMGSYNWSVSGGALPPGVALSPSGQVSGQPASAGNFTFVARVADSGVGVLTRSIPIRVTAAMAISACPASTAVVNQAYSAAMSVVGGAAPYTWSVSGALPSGLQLDPKAGTISGTPSQAVTSSFTVGVTDANSATASKACSINVVQALTITTAALSSASKGAQFTQQLSASGGTPPYAWSIANGNLPAGLNLAVSGALSGSPSAAGNFTFTARVTDNAGRTGDRNFTIAVANSLAIAGCPVNSGIAGQPYSSTVSASGGLPPYTWSLSSGSLPPGLTLNALSGAITGAPISAGNFSVTFQVTDKTNSTATQGCGLTITPALSIVTASLPDASQSSAYTQTLTAAGGKGPYVWGAGSGGLPPGLTLSATGILAGSPTQLGSFTFTLTVSDTTTASTQKSYTMNVFSGLIVGACPVSITEVGFAYNSALVGEGGVQPYVWSIASGSVPAGLQLNRAGTISGTPTQVGASEFTIAATDRSNQAAATKRCSIDVRPPVDVATSSLTAGNTGSAYTDSVTVTGGVPPYVWSTIAGSLPPGLSLDAATGKLTGRPVVAGAFAFTVEVVDNAGAQVTKDLSVTIAQGLSIPNCPSPVGSVGQPYSSALVALGGSPPYSWSISAGLLPAGLTLDSANALISGVPSQTGPASYVLRVDDAGGNNLTRACSVQISGAPLTIMSDPSLPSALVGSEYSQTLAASGGRPPYSWSIVSSGSPDAFALNATGTLAGVAGTAGTFTFMVQVTDQDNNVARQSVTLTILAGAAPNVSVAGLSDILDPAQQPTFNLQLDGSYPAQINGTVTLTFTPDPAVGVDDPSVQFATGGRTLKFTVAPNSKDPVFTAPVTAFQTGTVAGTIQLSIKLEANGTDITPANSVIRTVRLDRLAPKIVSMTVAQTSGGFEVRITGFATTREVTQGRFQVFTAGGGAPIEVAVPMSDPGKTWFQSSQSKAFGGQFSLVQPFTLQGQVGTLSSVTVTLSNAQGTSDPATAKF